MVQQVTEDLAWQNWVCNRDANSGDFLVKKYMPLVSYHVQRISVGLPKNVARDELTSLGMIGLFDALEKYDPSRDLKFDTYASFRVRGAIIDGLRKEDWLSRSTREKTKKVEAAIEKLEQRYMRNATVEEIAHETNMTVGEVYNLMNEQLVANVLSIDEKPVDNEFEDYSYVINDDRAILPEKRILKNETLAELSERITQLNDKEQLVISLFYKEELTLTEIGEVMSLSTSRISQIHSKAISKLKIALEKVI
ncbi:FliA/WhiG family RNA polymerase sigma factor [Cytobacillus purgationiresistens]|uniref:RNA polymerase sigma factor for flagellar operon FliA n=1 Tax=Cytobacillus purgationiresistens TaxID=863449 RepID=A0ABU0AG16_9BACI|nr:FliA/WhiG family RNA polymerase sigma factor [Cytobacillus purgationiresistens]MDQ0270204.1 RNA polymerase sigma factor for flagellar operon FliA [Cytobacillus purgationiresistens]